MMTCDGLSLTEVLVSLVMVTSASLALLEQQCHVSRYLYQINHRHEAVRQLDNASERFAAQLLPIVAPSYQLVTKPVQGEMPILMIQLHWTDASGDSHLERSWVRR